MATGNPATTRCAQCSEPATQVCNACKDAPDIGDNITEKAYYYCNRQCQVAHWSTHKSICKRLQTRKALYRAGATLQKVFYMYREKCFDKLVARIERRNGKMYIHEGVYNYEGMITEMDFLETFPESLCEREEEKLALLSHMACSDAVAWLHELIKYMIEDLASNIEERILKPKNQKRHMISVDITGGEDNAEYDHNVLEITLKHGGEKYILDLASAQYGYYDPVVLWMPYTRARVGRFLIQRPEFDYFGGQRAMHLAMRAGTDQNQKMYAIVNGECSQALKCGALEWEGEAGMKVRAMLILPDHEFKLRQKELVDHIAKYLQEYLDSMKVKAALAKARVAARRR